MTFSEGKKLKSQKKFGKTEKGILPPPNIESTKITRENAKRLVQGMEKSTADNIVQHLREEAAKVTDSKSFWQILNDNELLPPRGKNLLPTLSNLQEIATASAEQITYTLGAAMLILNFMSVNEVAAADLENSKKISWALEALEKIDPIKYIIHQHEKKDKRIETSKFSEEEKRILAWNIYHEARGENTAGKLGVLYSTFNRMKSGRYKSSAEGVVLQKNQFSWTRDIINPKEQKVDVKSYKMIRELVDQFTSENFDADFKKLKTTLEKEIGGEIPENITHYHVHKMFTTHPNVDKYKKDARPETINRVLKKELQYELENAQSKLDIKFKRTILKLGNHLFYSSN